jgi:putative membrane protein
MNFIIRLLLTAVAALLIGKMNIIDGIIVKNYEAALKAAIVLALLNTFLKPVLQLLTFPITLLTLGLWLIVLNVIIVYAAAQLVQGFAVTGFIPALFFSLAMSVVSWILNAIFD